MDSEKESIFVSDHDFIFDFLNQHSLAVISTVEADRPEAAVIGFGQTKQLEIIFGTFNSSRKYKNLQSREEVAFVIGWDEGQTIQYEGVAHELGGDEAKSLSELYHSKAPASRKYADHPEERYFKVTPTWIRYTDLRVEPWKIIELDLR